VLIVLQRPSSFSRSLDKWTRSSPRLVAHQFLPSSPRFEARVLIPTEGILQKPGQMDPASCPLSSPAPVSFASSRGFSAHPCCIDRVHSPEAWTNGPDISATQLVLPRPLFLGLSPDDRPNHLVSTSHAHASHPGSMLLLPSIVLLLCTERPLVHVPVALLPMPPSQCFVSRATPYGDSRLLSCSSPRFRISHFTSFSDFRPAAPRRWLEFLPRPLRSLTC
jgi:hypothetical protein